MGSNSSNSKMTVESIGEQTPQLNDRQPNEVPELVASSPDDRNWKGIGIALVVIVCVCALIVTAVVLLTPGDKNAKSGKSRIKLEEVLDGTFGFRKFNGTWISDHEFIYQAYMDGIFIYDAVNNSRQRLMTNDTFKQHAIATYSLSPDRQYVLLASKYKKVFRHTYIAVFMIYNMSSETVFPLLPDAPDTFVNYASWGPTGSQLVYVLENDVYYMSSVNTRAKQLTTTGELGVYFNGVPDWLYEEEILSDGDAIWWSEDGKHLAFASFNDSLVDIMKYSFYGSPSDIKNVYPQIINLRYPKPGKTNPTVSIWVANLSSNNPTVVEAVPPKEYADINYYFTTAQWMNNDSLSVTWMKRLQNSSIISICSQKNKWACVKNFQEDTNGLGWVDLYKSLVFTDDRKYYFVILPGPYEGSAGRFLHIAMIKVEDGSKVYLTSGKYDVVDILAYDATKRTVYYISTLENEPAQRHLYGVTDVMSKSPKSTCYTCNISPNCLTNDITFATVPNFYILECNGPGIPRVQIRNMDDEKIVNLDSNEDLEEIIETKALPTIRFLEVPVTTHYKAKVKLYLPPGLREDEITKYPLLLEVYGGPGSQKVLQSFSVGWGSYLASGKNIIYAAIDGRGSEYRGLKFLHEIYRKLGTVEVQDQITAIEHLKQTLPFIDKTKIAVFGWSYGGYVSSMILSTENTPFKCGISVAPVTNWLYYDSAYTERYMQMPTADDNLLSYEKSSVLRKAANFQGKKFLLVHGTADDNVHWQQSAMLAKALNDENVLYQMQIYPDERHGLLSVKSHLYTTIDKFLDGCYSESETSDSDES